jgi:hypothetical protein
MGCHPAAIEANLQGWTPTQTQGADPVGCDPVYRIDGVPMGATAKDFPPFTTVQYHFYRMRDNGLLVVINAMLVEWGRAH